MPPRAKKAPEAVAFGAAVRERRKAKRWTQERLAEAAGVSALQVGFCERGDNVPKLTLIGLEKWLPALWMLINCKSAERGDAASVVSRH